MLPELNPALSKPSYRDLTLVDQWGVPLEVEVRLPEEEHKALRTSRVAFHNALEAVITGALHKKDQDPAALLQALHNAEAQYWPDLYKHFGDPKMQDLLATFSRSQYDVTPPQHPTKHNLKNKLGIWTSGMRDIWPGTNEQEREFRRKHRSYFHFPERVASLGGVFVTPPDCTEAEHEELQDHMRNADPYWRTPPRVFPSTTVGEARKLFAYYEEDWPLMVETPNGEILSVFDQKMLPNDNKRDNEPVENFCDVGNFHEAPADIYLPGACFDYLEDKGLDYMIRIKDGKPLLMTKSIAAFAELLPPYQADEGLGYVTYFGVSNPEATMKLATGLKQKGKLDAAIVDTAHGALFQTEVVLQKLRDLLPDIPLGVGAVNDPVTLRRYQRIADFIKGPIGSGGVCNTYHTGVRRKDAYVAMLLSAASAGDVPLLIDGLGGGRDDHKHYREQQLDDTSEFTISMAFPWVIGRQAGGAHIARVESGNPLEEWNGVTGKFGSGEASSNANKRRRGARDKRSREDRRAEAIRTTYSEGVNDRFYPLRNPKNLAGMYYLFSARLRSAMSYTLGLVPRLPNGELPPPGKHMQIYQERAIVEHQGS